jgi:prepilin-type N-terminal cleavage/methylation domain-containing protein
MRFIIEQLREARKREEGFTLIELLIVILILGILAGIAVFASGPFRDRAEQACTDANIEIGVIADAAVDAGVTGVLYAQTGDCSGTGGGGGPSGFTVTQVQQGSAGLADDPTVTLAGAPAEGHTLVAISGHRGSEVGATMPAGWTKVGEIFFESSGTTGDRRHIAVFTRVVEAGDPATVQVTWPAARTSVLVVREFDQSLGSASLVDAHSDAITVDTLVAGPATGASGSALVISGLGLRDDPGVTGLSWNIGGTLNADGGNFILSSGFTSVADGSAGHSATASWTSDAYASGFVMVMTP